MNFVDRAVAFQSGYLAFKVNNHAAQLVGFHLAYLAVVVIFLAKFCDVFKQGTIELHQVRDLCCVSLTACKPVVMGQLTIFTDLFDDPSG